MTTVMAISPHQRLSLSMREISWELNMWHPRDLYDPNQPPDMLKSVEQGVMEVRDKQWFTAILPCRNVEQFVYCHMDYPPHGMWMIDIVDSERVQRLYPTILSMIYHTKDVVILKPTHLIIHMYRDVSNIEKEYPMPRRATCGSISPDKFNTAMTAEFRKISTDFNAFVDAIHDKFSELSTNNSEP